MRFTCPSGHLVGGRRALAAACVLAVAGCGARVRVGAPIVLADAQPALVNVLSVRQSTLALPAGWRFARAEEKPTREGKLWTARFFDFKDDTGACEGAFQYAHAEMTGVIDPEKFGTLWADTLLTALVDVELHATRIGGKDSRIVTAHDRANRHDVAMALVPEGKGVNFILMACVRGSLSLQTAYAVFGSYRRAPKNFSERRFPGVWDFRDSTGTWTWVTDFQNPNSRGYVVLAAENGKPIGIGVGSTSAASVEELAASFLTRGMQQVGGRHARTVTVAGRALEADSLSFRAAKAGDPSVELLLVRGRAGNHMVSVHYDPALTSGEPAADIVLRSAAAGELLGQRLSDPELGASSLRK